jgi:putative FmdB family regulatory protein
MPIYAYRCSTCGHAKDVLQKVSDPLLSTCPACGAETFCKQVTAAGFQLKGSGWYVTDFRNGSAGSAAKGDASQDEPAKAAADGPKAEGAKADASKPASAAAPAAGPAAAPAPAPAPAAPQG